MTSARQSPVLALLLVLSLFGWAIKQAVNIIQVVISVYITSVLARLIPFYNSRRTPVHLNYILTVKTFIEAK